MLPQVFLSRGSVLELVVELEQSAGYSRRYRAPHGWPSLSRSNLVYLNLDTCCNAREAVRGPHCHSKK